MSDAPHPLETAAREEYGTLEDYERHLHARHLVPQTVRQTMRNLRAFLTWRADDDWRDVTLDDLTGWHDALSRRGNSTNTRCHKLWDVKRFMAWLHLHRAILVNPAANLPPLRKAKTLPHSVLSPSQINRLILAPGTATPEGLRDRAMFELLYSSGLRSSELCQLTLYNLDAQKRLVTVLQGKGRKDRLVPVGRVALKSLALYITQARPVFAVKARPGITAMRLFLTARGDAFTTQRLLVMVRRYAQQAALPATTTTHSFRHACATGMLRGGANIRHIQEMLGHSSILTTQVYTHVVKDDLKRIHARTAPSERRTKTDAPAFKFARWRPRRAKAC